MIVFFLRKNGAMNSLLSIESNLVFSKSFCMLDKNGYTLVETKIVTLLKKWRNVMKLVT